MTKGGGGGEGPVGSGCGLMSGEGRERRRWRKKQQEVNQSSTTTMDGATGCWRSGALFSLSFRIGGLGVGVVLLFLG